MRVIYKQTKKCFKFLSKLSVSGINWLGTMERISRGCKKSVCINLLLYSAILAATFFIQCADGRRLMHLVKEAKHTEKLKVTKHFDLASLLLQRETMDPSNTNPNSVPYVSSPFSLPPYDSLPPIQNAPPFCIYPPNTPPTPTATIPTPIGGGSYTPSPPSLPIPGPPPSPTGEFPSPNPQGPSGVVFTPPASIPNPPITIPFVPSPPMFSLGPPGSVPSPPFYIPSPQVPVFSPPYYEPSPPTTIVPNPPAHSGFNPSPPVFEPPVVFPPPMVPPPPSRVSPSALWCVAKPSVPDPIIQEAMNYACGSGADCGSIQPSGSCYEPNSVFAHASYAFNSYWQKTKVAGGSCSFGGTAILVTVDPSYDGCHFTYI